ncbi:hypothetical protein LNTAR_19277 [Lentisphaera araneosa HTCC2155]|uniref:Uncharacterized protein n=1 Tax=Lentisphaera araneosa HTCC2155 TaxID=313628 RepID=A6DQS1_9BACT|nr:hypothetical protein [Lentisphaera araneosa]EDM25971.1 hypothetical protein LNTAR_19277 [Lentisphaera araneosa HTCC2155]
MAFSVLILIVAVGSFLYWLVVGIIWLINKNDLSLNSDVKRQTDLINTIVDQLSSNPDEYEKVEVKQNIEIELIMLVHTLESIESKRLKKKILYTFDKVINAHSKKKLILSNETLNSIIQKKTHNQKL